MIVLDEQLKNSGVAEQIAGWYRGRVVNITTLRPGTVIKDDAIPVLLLQASDPTFVTINTTDTSTGSAQVFGTGSQPIDTTVWHAFHCPMIEWMKSPICYAGFFASRNLDPNANGAAK